jgi:predicted amidohydrolase
MKIAVVQTNPKHKDIKHNLARMLETIERTDADLLIFPELALTGYLFTSREAAFPFARPIDSGEMNSIAAKCRESGKSIVFGHLELSEEALFNSAIVIDHAGNVIGHYRKTHLFHFERLVFSPGDTGFKVFDLTLCGGELIKLGVMICYDWRFPESARSLALQGADIIAIPSNIVTRTGMLHTVLQTRAFENKVIVAFADRIGSESGEYDSKASDLTYRGESCIINYNGELLAKLDDKSEEIATSEVDIVATRNKSFSELNNIFTDRRPDVY